MAGNEASQPCKGLWDNWCPEMLADDFGTWYRPWTWINISKKEGHSRRRVHDKKPRLLLAESSLSSSSSLQSAPYILQCLPFFEIRKSPKGGYGAFATQAISPSTDIIQEKPFLISGMGEFNSTFLSLPQEAKNQLFELSWFSGAANDKTTALFRTNRFEIGRGKCAVFQVGSRFNHACYPNCHYFWHEISSKMVFKTKNPIAAGEEITISYGHLPYELWVLYGFMCDCGECSPPRHLIEAEEMEKEVRGAKKAGGK